MKVIQEFKFVNVGFGSMVATHQILIVTAPDPAPVKRLITEARSQKCLVDATYGRRTRSVIVMHSGHIILSSIQPDTLTRSVIVMHSGHIILSSIQPDTLSQRMEQRIQES